MDEAASPTGMSRGAMIVPIANVGALSQAWFDALGLARPRDPGQQKTTQTALDKSKQPNVVVPSRAFDTPHTIAKAPLDFERKPHVRNTPGNERLAARVERTVIRKQGGKLGEAQGGANDILRRSAGRIVIHTTRGSVKMLVQRDNNRLVITAVCDAKVAGNIAAALDTARTHLRARGIAADVYTYGENAA